MGRRLKKIKFKSGQQWVESQVPALDDIYFEDIIDFINETAKRNDIGCHLELFDHPRSAAFGVADWDGGEWLIIKKSAYKKSRDNLDEDLSEMIKTSFSDLESRKELLFGGLRN